MANVSVIMGVYNCCSRLDLAKAALESICNQTYKDIEIIICDDGSTDNTLYEIKQITKNYDNIKLIHNDDNNGLGYALNCCLKYATGKYIARMDIDDVSTNNRFEVQLNYLESHDEISFVGCNVDLARNGKIWGQRIFKEYPEKKDFLFGNQVTHATIMIRKDDLISVGGYKSNWYSIRNEDYDLLMRLYAKGYKAHNIQEKMYVITEDDTSYSRRKYRYRFGEVVVRLKGFFAMGLLPRGIVYVFKPLIIGFIPQKILEKMRKESL